MDAMEKLIKDYLKTKEALLGQGDSMRSTEEYYRYIAGEMSGGEEADMLTHLASSREAQELVLKAKRLVEEENESVGQAVPSKLPKKAQGLSGKKSAPKRFLWTIFWLSLTIVSLVLSFVVHRYYMQFLVLALLFGFKCIMDHKVYKTQILIYKALEEHPEAEQKLKDKNRIF